MCPNGCKFKKSNPAGQAAGIWSGFLLLLVPKCPFCFMAFSGVMVFCGENASGQHLRSFYSSTTLILTAFICLTAFINLVLYKHPVRIIYALLLSIPGMAALLFSVTTSGGLLLYYTGAFLVMAGLLYNSGFWSLVEKTFAFRKKMRREIPQIFMDR